MTKPFVPQFPFLENGSLKTIKAEVTHQVAGEKLADNRGLL